MKQSKNIDRFYILVQWIGSILFLFFLLFPLNSQSEVKQEIELFGKVPERMELNVSANEFDFGNPAETGHDQSPVANISVNSNAENGWSLRVSSKNGTFELKNGSFAVPYTLQYGSETIQDQGVIIDSMGSEEGATLLHSKDLFLSLEPDKSLPSGVYSDQLIIELEAN